MQFCILYVIATLVGAAELVQPRTGEYLNMSRLGVNPSHRETDKLDQTLNRTKRGHHNDIKLDFSVHRIKQMILNDELGYENSYLFRICSKKLNRCRPIYPWYNWWFWKG